MPWWRAMAITMAKLDGNTCTALDLIQLRHNLSSKLCLRLPTGKEPAMRRRRPPEPARLG